jgi:hypothetical protein
VGEEGQQGKGKRGKERKMTRPRRQKRKAWSEGLLNGDTKSSGRTGPKPTRPEGAGQGRTGQGRTGTCSEVTGGLKEEL